MNLTSSEKVLIFEVVGIEEYMQNGQKVKESKTYPLGQLGDADSILKKLITKGIPFTETVQFDDGEVEFSKTEMALIKQEFEKKQMWKLAQKDLRDSIVAKFKSVVV